MKEPKSMIGTPRATPLTDEPNLWRGRTQLERSTERRQLLLDAAAAIIGAEEVDALGVRAICRRAGLTERYFYESFDSLDVLLGELYEKVLVEVHAQMVAATVAAGNEPRAEAKAAVESLADQLLFDRVKSRLFLLEHSGHSALVHQVARKSQRNRIFFAGLITRLNPALNDDPEGLSLSVRALLASQAALFLAWAAGELTVSRERFVAHALAILESVAAIDSSGRSVEN